MLSKKKKVMPQISTASLPDIVFMLLFFFMVVTVMRNQSLKVQIEYPKATELQKLERRSLISHIYIGQPNSELKKHVGDAPIVQLNDKTTRDLSYIGNFIQNSKDDVPESLQPKMTTSLKIDKDVKMGLVSEVKQALRKANALKINYASIPITTPN